MVHLALWLQWFQQIDQTMQGFIEHGHWFKYDITFAKNIFSLINSRTQLHNFKKIRYIKKRTYRRVRDFSQPVYLTGVFASVGSHAPDLPGVIDPGSCEGVCPP